jgi:hypothetical protein
MEIRTVMRMALMKHMSSVKTSGKCIIKKAFVILSISDSTVLVYLEWL